MKRFTEHYLRVVICFSAKEVNWSLGACPEAQQGAPPSVLSADSRRTCSSHRGTRFLKVLGEEVLLERRVGTDERSHLTPRELFGVRRRQFGRERELLAVPWFSPRCLTSYLTLLFFTQNTVLDPGNRKSISTLKNEGTGREQETRQRSFMPA